MKNVSIAALTALTLATATATAHAGAAFGYVCDISLQPASMSTYNGFGTEGDILLILNSQPDCGGTQVMYEFLMSTGATVTGVNSTYLYTAAELQAIYQSLVVARNKATQRIVAAGLATTNTLQVLTVTLE